MFFVRNNLTVVEVVTVSGIAVHLNFTLDGIHPLVTEEQYENVSLAKPILFDLKPNYLAEHCNGTFDKYILILLISNVIFLKCLLTVFLTALIACVGNQF